MHTLTGECHEDSGGCRGLGLLLWRMGRLEVKQEFQIMFS